MARSREDAALGAVLGALIGDAAGAVLEFLGRAPSVDEVQEALRFPGGGVWRVAPGQITDDGELTLCLARGLVEGGGTFPSDAIASWYGRWYQSSPFDIGGTTRTALQVADQGLGAGLADRMRAAAAASSGSKANGSLMRCTPLGVWGFQLADDELVAIAKGDSSLSHPNASCCGAVALYTAAVASLVARPGDLAGAVARVRELAASGAVPKEVAEWLATALSGQSVPFWPQAGFVKIAFVHAFRHLAGESGFEVALAETLRGGGDTDTNACIVGGLVGAALGASRIPEAMKAAVLGCDPTRGRKRPEFLWARDAPELVTELLRVAPERLELA